MVASLKGSGAWHKSIFTLLEIGGLYTVSIGSVREEELSALAGVSVSVWAEAQW